MGEKFNLLQHLLGLVETTQYTASYW